MAVYNKNIRGLKTFDHLCDNVLITDTEDYLTVLHTQQDLN